MSRDISNFTCVSTATLQNIFPKIGYEKAPQFAADAKQEPTKATVKRASVRIAQRKRNPGRPQTGH
jgi:hypothetical protein